MPPKQVDGSRWVHHRGLNCWQGRGAEGIEARDPWHRAASVQDCKAECERYTACDGVVMFADQFPLTCWLRSKLHLNECVDYPEYDFFERVPAGGAEKSTIPTRGAEKSTTPVALPMPSSPDLAGGSVSPPDSADVSGWVHHDGLNCWPGRGAEAIDGRDPWQQSHSVEDCKAECQRYTSCDAIVVLKEQFHHMCWLRTKLQIDDCIDFPHYDVFERVHA